MLNQEQINDTYTFANTVGAFINREKLPLFMDRWENEDQIHNTFFVYGPDGRKYFLGELYFSDKKPNYYIDGEVICYLQERGWI